MKSIICSSFSDGAAPLQAAAAAVPPAPAAVPLGQAAVPLGQAAVPLGQAAVPPPPAAAPLALNVIPLGLAAAAAVPLARQKPVYHPESRLNGGHFPGRLGHYSSGEVKYRDCFVCTARATCMPAIAKKRRTPRWCEKCGKALCVDKHAWGKQVSCFQLYHSLKDFKH